MDLRLRRHVEGACAFDYQGVQKESKRIEDGIVDSFWNRCPNWHWYRQASNAIRLWHLKWRALQTLREIGHLPKPHAIIHPERPNSAVDSGDPGLEQATSFHDEKVLQWSRPFVPINFSKDHGINSQQPGIIEPDCHPRYPEANQRQDGLGSLPAAPARVPQRKSYDAGGCDGQESPICQQAKARRAVNKKSVRINSVKHGGNSEDSSQ